MLTEEQIRELEASEAPEAREMAQRLRDGLAARARIEAEYRAKGDWDGLLSLAGSEHRAAVLVEALGALPTADERAKMMSEWFNLCDALAPHREQLRAYLDEMPFFTDEEGAESVPQFPVVVYRGAWADDDAENALSWTLDRAFAEKFARGLVGLRARLVLGMYREDSAPTIFRATAVEAYGYLNSRAEREVIAKKLRSVEPIAELVPGR